MEQVKFKTSKSDKNYLDFFKERGLEIFEADETESGKLLFCLSMWRGDIFLGAASVYREGADFMLDKFAIAKQFERQGWGGYCLEKP